MAPRAGATAVEFAVVVPILLLTIWAGITFVRANMIRHTVENAAYVASRAVIVPGATQEEAIEEAQRLLGVLGIRDAEITFDPSVIEEDTLFVTTEISVPMQNNSWGMNRFMKDAMFFGSSTLRTERTPAQQVNGLPTVIDPPESTEPIQPEPPEPTDSGESSDPQEPPQPSTPPPVRL